MELEEIDIEILKKLSVNSRKSYRKLAKELEKSPMTIKKHVENLEQRGIIKNYGINIDYEKLGYDIIALIELTISEGNMIQIEQEIADDPHVFAVYDLTGTYDSIILVRIKSRSDLNNLVKRINNMKAVVRTNTHLILNVIKEGTDLAKLMVMDILNKEP
ncbi:MAG: Lrp/AsnC family transcriptional regulator [Promethearchaeota archaeon]